MNQEDLKGESQSTLSLQEATFAITTDTGTLERQSLLLCKSIRKYYPEAQIINFVPESSIRAIRGKARRFFEENTTIITGEIPIPEYNISAKLKSFAAAADMADYKQIIMLDTDTVLMSPITLPNGKADLYVKPANVGAQYWGSPKSMNDWKKLYKRFDVAFPTTRVQSTVDKRMILPYWNAGVVITNDHSVPPKLLEMTNIIFNEDIIEKDEDFFLDQLALAILSETRCVSQIWELQNYPLNARLACPTEVQLIHYSDFQHLIRVPNLNIRRKLRSLGLKTNCFKMVDMSEILLDFIYNHSGRYLPYQQKRILGEYLTVMQGATSPSSRSEPQASE